MNESLVRPGHGGNLEAIARAYGVASVSLLDFSANINPLGPPASLLRALREAIGEAHGLDPAAIVVGNGGAALLDAAIAALHIRRALVPTPAFSEYRRALASRGAAFVAAPLDRKRDFALDVAMLVERADAAAADAVIVNTPHNPSGSSLSGDDARALVRALRDESRATIVDEAFVDYIETQSIVETASRTPALVVVRSLTKFFAVPALRVGFAVARPDVAERMRAYLPSWPVTAIAATAIAAALRDRTYATQTRTTNAEARAALRDGLAARGLRVLPSVANYVLVELPPMLTAAGFTARAIAEHGIVLRDCTSYDDLGDGRFVRIAVRSAADNTRLLAAFEAISGAGEPARALGSASS